MSGEGNTANVYHRDSPWPAGDAELTNLWSAGHSTSDIGRRMHLSRNAIIGRARRIGLPGRPSPIKRDPDTVPAQRHIWTPEETDRLCSLRADGHTYAEIGRRIGVSSQSAQDKGYGLDLPPRVLKSGTLPPLPTLAPLLRITLPPQQRLALTRNPPQPPANVVQLRLPIARARACQYPLWGALHADDRPVFGRMCDDPRPGLSPRFCEKPAAVGASYCTRHVAITHRKAAEAAA